jgi:hypothetical protein
VVASSPGSTVFTCGFWVSSIGFTCGFGLPRSGLRFRVGLWVLGFGDRCSGQLGAVGAVGAVGFGDRCSGRLGLWV